MEARGSTKRDVLISKKKIFFLQRRSPNLNSRMRCTSGYKRVVSRSQTLIFFTCGRKSRVWSTYVQLFVLADSACGLTIIVYIDKWQ